MSIVTLWLILGLVVMMVVVLLMATKANMRLSIACLSLTVVLYYVLGGHQQLRDRYALDDMLVDIKAELSTNQNDSIALIEAVQNHESNFGRSSILWAQAGELYERLGSDSLAAHAFSKAYHFSENYEYAIRWIHHEAMANGGRLSLENDLLLKDVLEQYPDNLNAHSILAMDSFLSGDLSLAKTLWQKCLILMRGEDEGERASIKKALNHIDSLLGIEPNVINISVSLDPNITVTPNENDIVFIYAKQPNEMMPRAVKRIRVADLEQGVTLDKSTAMVNTHSIDDVDSVIIGARLSKSGNAIKKAGDWQSEEQLIVLPTSKSYKLVISTQLTS